MIDGPRKLHQVAGQTENLDEKHAAVGLRCSGWQDIGNRSHD